MRSFYCRMSLQSAMGVGRELSIASAVVDPMQQEAGFRTEELEMLATEV